MRAARSPTRPLRALARCACVLRRLGLGRPFDFRQADLEVDARVVVVNQLLARSVPAKHSLP